MKITAVERIPVDVGFKPRPARHMARELWNWSISEVIRLRTDSGIVGYGETLPHYTWGRVSEEAANRVIGHNPLELLWDDSLGAGLQMAIWDAAGKAAGVPCYRFIGQKGRSDCPISWWAIDMPPEEWAGEAADAVNAGYTSFKLKARPWFDIVEQVRAVCEIVPAYFQLDVDFNALLLEAGKAVPVLQKLEAFFQVAVFETPIWQHDIEGCRQVRAKVTRPIAMHFGSPPFLTAVKEEVCDGFVVGGGAANLVRQGTLAAEAHKPFWLQLVGTGLTTAFALHFGAALTHSRWPAITCLNIYADDLLVEPIEVREGYARVPEAPGLGVAVDEDALERLRLPSSDPKPAPRRLLTVAWPSGRRVHYASAKQMYADFWGGNQPIFEPGVNLTWQEDDGSAEFDELLCRAMEAPVIEKR
ncbi:MAG TPA: enolase C-terminal domain-like protein [Chthonomonadales bacterium]|nr:enolase C-terminal domain-like protein [Chthonomonadales bacterium]